MPIRYNDFATIMFNYQNQKIDDLVDDEWIQYFE